MIVDRRKRILIFLAICFVVLLLLAWLLWSLFHKEPAPTPVVEAPKELVVNVPPEPEVSPIAEQKREGRIQAAGMNTLAKTFAERYGSYSNEANFQNLLDLKPLMTQAFAEQTQAFIDTTPLPEGYYGITTRAITVEVQTLDEEAGTATVELNTQREEAKVSPANTTVWYQKLRLEFVMEDGTWKIASATWL